MSTEDSPPAFAPVFSTRPDPTTATVPSGKGAYTLPACSPAAAAALVRGWMELEPEVPTVVVTDSARSLDTFYQDLHTLLDGDLSRTAFFPGWEDVADADLHGVSPEIAGDRLQTLIRLHADPAGLCVCTHVQSLLQPVPDPDHLGGRVQELSLGMELDPDAFCLTLQGLGYIFEAEVTDKGEAARRGGVLDLWPPNQAEPVRLEFFGSELDSLRRFDPTTQRSEEKCAGIRILPARESASEETAVFTDYLPTDTRWLILDSESVADHAVLAVESMEDVFLTWAELQQDIRKRAGKGRVLTGDRTGGTPLTADLAACAGLADIPGGGDTTARLEQERERLIRQQLALAESGWSVVFCLNTDGSRARFLETYGHLINTRGQPAHMNISSEGQARADRNVHLCGLTPCVVTGMLSEGFRFSEWQLSVVGERDLYGLRKPARSKYDPHASTRRKTGSAGERFTTGSDIEPGEWVVHLEHGIGKYLGLFEIEMAGQTQEVLSIEYAGGAKLHVPVSQAHLLSRYMGVGGTVPEPHTLGGSAWHRQKAVAEKAVRDLAGQLLRTQAMRESHPGHAFPSDTPWQAEFEATFPFTETADQEEAIRAVKADMERTRPMDRLICGDVGYGKTEVAMRAAFKAVMDGKQVAMLVPTTVLALQHTQTFRERMAAFPVSIEMLSRFRTAGEQKEVIRRMAAGQVDIVIGTHRLTSQDVRFHDLGLVIIDEEQRFGVRHKERLKEMKGLVDVLTLSATPIPRTLYLSLTGARDVSSIQTAPRERLPVQTEVLAFDEERIRSAILREMNRGGQIFFLHNRVQTLNLMRRRLMALVPEARISMGHGQMAERHLEGVVRSFANGDSDVLLCTTIIESGIDLPNVNTMIIDRADRFGLAELYQLRGRVGRYKHQAHCLLLLPEGGGSKAVARERLRAIRKYSALGSGFKIALRDLEIRGAGNLLGPQQSGHIASVGFELYCQLLEQSIRRMKKLPPERLVETTARLDFLDLRPEAAGDNACTLPASYIEDEALRVDLYRRIAALATRNKVEALRTEMRDRFGRLPAAAEHLLQVAEVRIAASDAGLREVEVRDRKVYLRKPDGTALQPHHRYPRLSATTASEQLQELLELVGSFRPTAP
jgi:transcription-repair coupling factor (superfamily II helicase)